MSLPRDLDDCVYEIACELAELSADSPWDRVKRIVQRRYKPPLSPYNKDLQGVYEKYYKRRLSDLQADKGLPPTPPDTASLNPPTNSLDRGSDAAEQISPSYNVIRIICTRADSPVKVLPSDSEDLEVSYKEPEKDDWGYYITDQVCETYCAPADIGKEVEVTYQWIGEKDERKGHFVVREAMNMGADVVCPRADPDDIMMVEDAHSNDSEPGPVSALGLTFRSEEERMTYTKTSRDEGFQDFLATTLARTDITKRSISKPNWEAHAVLASWRFYKFTHPEFVRPEYSRRPG